MPAPNTLTETWRPVPRFDDLIEVSNTNRVRISPNAPADYYPRRSPGDELSAHLGKTEGYWRVNARRPDGSYTSLFMHRLLMEAFRPVPGMAELQVNHRDGDKSNNSLDNLEWCTHRENLAHAWATGLRTCPSPAKLTPDEVREIRRIWASTERGDWTLNTLGRRYGVTLSAIWRIVHYKNWPHVTL
jgi:hypothetical protein